MSEFDILAANFVQHKLLPVFIVVTVFVVLLKRVKSLRWHLFSWYCMKIYKEYTDVLAQCKVELFAQLRNFRSQDWYLRNQGLVRIVELGVGEGSNFQYYPKNARVIAVDSNAYFKKYVEERRMKFPDVKIESVILGSGEDMGFLGDNSVDVVVTTIYLCSVNDVNCALREIHRILAPGGKYFFLEHDIGSKGSWNRCAQKLGKYVWPFVFNGCHIDRDIRKAICQSGFARVEYKRFTAKLRPCYRLFIGPHISGTATKGPEPGEI